MSNEIDIIKMLQILLRRLWLMIIIVLLCGAMIFAYSTYFIQATYTATTTMYVKIEDSASTYQDYTNASKLVDSCLVILQSNTVLNQVAEQTGLNYTTREIYNMISVASVNDTAFFTVNVTTTKPQDAKIIADALGQVAPQEILRIYNTGSAVVLDKSVLPTKPSGPNIQQNTILGCFAGLVLSVLLIFVIEMFSTSIKSEQDLLDNFHLPVLGSIPEFDASPKAKKSKHNRRYGYNYSN